MSDLLEKIKKVEKMMEKKTLSESQGKDLIQKLFKESNEESVNVPTQEEEKIQEDEEDDDDFGSDEDDDDDFGSDEDDDDDFGSDEDDDDDFGSDEDDDDDFGSDEDEDDDDDFGSDEDDDDDFGSDEDEDDDDDFGSDEDEDTLDDDIFGSDGDDYDEQGYEPKRREINKTRKKKKQKTATIEEMYKSLKKKSYDWPIILDETRRDNPPWINGEYKTEPPIQFCAQTSISTYKSTMRKAVDDFTNNFGPHRQMTRRQFVGIISPLLYNQDTPIFSDYSAGRTYTTSLKRIYIEAVRNNEI